MRVRSARHSGLAVVSLLGGALLLAGCGGGQEEAAGTSPADSEEGVVVELVEFRFEPEEIVIPAGTRVTFVNKGSVRHNVVEGPPGERTGFAAPFLMPADSWSYVFQTPGTYQIHCNADGHDLLNMRATVIVQ